MRHASVRTRPVIAALAALAVAVAGGCGGSGPAAAPGAAAAPQVSAPAREALIARARSLELDTPYVPPPGDPLEHQTAGFAKIMCSAVFITGLDPDFAAENVGYFTGPYLERARVGKPVIDRAAKTVRVTIPGGPTLTAKYLGSQGCVTSPPGSARWTSRRSRSPARCQIHRLSHGRWETCCRTGRFPQPSTKPS